VADAGIEHFRFIKGRGEIATEKSLGRARITDLSSIAYNISKSLGVGGFWVIPKAVLPSGCMEGALGREAWTGRVHEGIRGCERKVSRRNCIGNISRYMNSTH
jgi:hypothetical protein